MRHIEKENEKRMYKVIGKEETLKVLTLAEAMNVAKHLNEFVTISGPNFEIVGMFGTLFPYRRSSDHRKSVV